jgi:hypothetical protein
MAEDLAFVGLAGGGSGGIGSAVGRIIGDLERALGRVASALIRALKSFIDKVTGVAVRVARVIEKYFRLAVHYVILFLRLGYRYMYRFYTQFQQNPWKTLQFIGTVAILFNNGLFP